MTGVSREIHLSICVTLALSLSLSILSYVAICIYIAVDPEELIGCM